MNKLLIIGAGGVGNVVAHKCAQSGIFTEIALASRTLSRCEGIRDAVKKRTGVDIKAHQLDADAPENTAALIRELGSELVINVALPYQDLAIMDACLETGVHYLDTANYEPPEIPKFEYKWQWAYHERFQKKNIMALLGSGFDPGVTNVFCAYAAKHHFDRIDTIDIIDCNAGDHGLAFATNFNPEINIREITQKGRYWQEGKWVETEPLSVSRDFPFPDGIGPKQLYLLYHEEMESLSKHLAHTGLKKMRFWMTFSEKYLTHLRVLQSVGMTSIEPVMYEGHPVVPLKFLQAVLPDPASLGALTSGKTCIGCLIRGQKDGKPRIYYVYNVCVHEACYDEVGSQAISYTTGVPAMIGALLMATGVWMKPGVYNMEQFDPDPFMELLSEHGLPWTENFDESMLGPLARALDEDAG